MINSILTNITTSISEFKKNPMKVMKSAEGFPLAVLNHNKPAFYCITAELFESMIDQLEDVQLAILVNERMNEQTEEIDIKEL
jgi:antitoxin StbD